MSHNNCGKQIDWRETLHKSVFSGLLKLFIRCELLGGARERDADDYEIDIPNEFPIHIFRAICLRFCRLCAHEFVRENKKMIYDIRTTRDDDWQGQTNKIRRINVLNEGFKFFTSEIYGLFCSTQWLLGNTKFKNHTKGKHF